MNIKNILSLGSLFFAILFLTSCGSSSGGGSVTGHFVDDRVEGLVYHCSSGNVGKTGSDGGFTCSSGDSVTFYLGTNQFGPVPALNSLVSPYSLFPDNPVAALNFARLLQSIDQDGDPDNGVILANDSLVALLPDNVNFSSSTFFDDIRSALGITLVTSEQAQLHLDEAIVKYVAESQPGISIPVPNAGVDQHVTTGSQVNLDGSGSFDADGDTLIYTWGILSKPAGSSAVIVDYFNVISTTFIADVAGVYEVVLMVSDDISTRADRVVITAVDDGNPAISNNADLSALTLSAGTLSPVFNAATLSYGTTVANATNAITVTPGTADAGATVTVNGTAVASGTTSNEISLIEGNNIISIVVTAEDATTSKTYTLTVTRQALTPGVPAAPQGFQATAGDAQVALSWGAVTGADSYALYWNTTGGVTTADNRVDAGSNIQFSHTGRTNDVTYYYRVAASNTSGEGALSSEVSATPTAPATDVPAAPQNFQAIAGDGTIAFSWDAAAGATSYAVYWTDTGVFTELFSIDVGNATQFTLGGLSHGTTYYCRVYAVNNVGKTSSNVLLATPDFPVPQALQATAGNGQVELSWNAVGDVPYYYKVYWNTTGSVTTQDASLDAGTSTQFTHTGLSDSTTYYYRVSATGVLSEGELSDEVASALPTTWQWANPKPQGNSIEGMVWGNNQYVAIGLGGLVVTSPDGSNWTEQSSGTENNLWDIEWNGSKYVAVGKNTILTSADGITWTAQSFEGTAEFVDITWNGNLFVTVSYKTILTSPDGVTWTSQANTATGYLRDIVWNGSLFVIYEYPGNIHTSADGILWSKHTGAVSNLNSIVWDGGRFVATGYDGVYTSSDGVTWVNTGATSAVGSLIWDGSQYAGTGQNGLISTSTDALNWTTQVTNTTERLITLVWNGSQYVAGGSSGTILSSSDLVTWTRHLPTVLLTTESLNDVVWNGSQFVIVGRTGLILTSPDGDTWTSRDSGVTSLSLESINWNGSQYMVVGTDFLTSPDGVNWTIRDAGTSASGVVWDGSQYVAVGGYQKMVTSPDGINWTAHDINSKVGFVSVVWNGSIFVAVGGYNTGYNIMTSPDGMNWTVNANLFGRLDDVIWANNQFVAVGAIGRTYTSPDGLTWTAHYEVESSSGYLINVEWDGSQYVISSAEGHIYTSPDGINLTRRNTGSGNWLQSITWNDAGKAVAAGVFGTIITNSSW